MEKFSLKWDDFLTNVTKSFQSLRYENDFFDITLIGDDYKHVTAHKLVLSSCSEYFKNVFSNNKKYFESKAMICLEGLIHSDLNNVLDFIYEGQVQIYQHDLDRFLRIAERLKLEGLMKQHEDDKTEDTLVVEIPTLQKDLFVSKSENQMTRDDGIIKIEKPVIQSFRFQSMEELDQIVEDSFNKLPNGLFSCNHCDTMSEPVWKVAVNRNFDFQSFAIRQNFRKKMNEDVHNHPDDVHSIFIDVQTHL